MLKYLLMNWFVLRGLLLKIRCKVLQLIKIDTTCLSERVYLDKIKSFYFFS